MIRLLMNNNLLLIVLEELNKKLEEFASFTDNLEEVFENREQIEISKLYEKLPKPTLLAMQEFIEGKIYFRNPAREALSDKFIVEEEDE